MINIIIIIFLGGGSHGNQYNIRKIETFKQQQQQQTMSNVANCITPVSF